MMMQRKDLKFIHFGVGLLDACEFDLIFVTLQDSPRGRHGGVLNLPSGDP